MTLRPMIDAARTGNAVEFQKQFSEQVASRLGTALADQRAATYRSVFGLSESVEPDLGIFAEALSELTEEELDLIIESDEQLELFIERTLGQSIRSGAYKGAKTGAVAGGAAGGALGATAGGIAAGGAGAVQGGKSGVATGAVVGGAVGAVAGGAAGAVKHGVKKLAGKFRQNRGEA